MPNDRMVVWLDHVNAHIVHIQGEEHQTSAVQATDPHPHIHYKQGSLGAGKMPDDKHYLEDIIDAIKQAKEVLIVGPGSAKMELIKALHTRHAELSDRIVGVETVNHPTDSELLDYARQYFRTHPQLL